MGMVTYKYAFGGAESKNRKGCESFKWKSGGRDWKRTFCFGFMKELENERLKKFTR